MEEFDTIIVGAGSAGCVLANRLTEDGRHTVLVLECGGSDRSLFIRMPAALSIPMNNPRYNWFYETEPEPALNGRRLHTPRGKVVVLGRAAIWSTGSIVPAAHSFNSAAVGSRRFSLEYIAGSTDDGLPEARTRKCRLTTVLSPCA